jgi:PAS domain S-box-containing protein
VTETSTSLSADVLLAAIVDSSDDAIVSKNLRSVVTSWNQGACRIFGYLPEEMIGQPIDRLFPKDRLHEEAGILDRIVRGERVEHFETQRLRKDGTLIDVSLTISPIRNAEGTIIGASKIARDISDQKKAQRELAQAHDQLRRADQMKVEFLSTLSHELRTPLSAITGWIQILNENPTAEELSQGLQVIERNVRAQTQLIDDLLDMSRIEAGKITIDLQRVDVPGIVSQAMETVRAAAEAKEIRLTQAFSSVEGVVMGDKNRLQQVMWNLLTNSIKFTPKQGRVHVVVRRSKSQVEISVADNGQGIAPEFLGHVFDRFQQADASTTRRYGGLGLGLSIVKNLVELHGGTVRAASLGVGQGATFSILLPLLPAYHAAERAEGGEANSDLVVTDLKGVKVLVVDDELDSAEVIGRVLRRCGAEIQLGHSMRQGLETFERFRPDVVISDIGMPEHDGYEFIAGLRMLPRGPVVPVVALTALARSEDRTRALRAGFQLHLAKPVDAAELVAVVQNLAALRLRGGGQ